MSLFSKPKKLKPKGTVRELKLVHTINRHGADTIKAEVVKTPQKSSQTVPSTSRPNRSLSPIKRPRMEIFDSDPIPFNLEDPDISGKRQTMVFLFYHDQQLCLTISRAKMTFWDSSSLMRRNI